MSDPKLRELLLAMVILTLALIVAFSPDAYVPMLARAFIVPLCGCSALFAVFTALRRRWWIAQAAAVGCAIMAVQLPWSSYVAIAQEADGPSLRVFHMNVLQPNTAFDEAIGEALASNADVISVQEVGVEWGLALETGLRRTYPFAHSEVRDNCYGIALFSKRPFTAVRTLTMSGTPFIEVVIDAAGTPVRLLAVHTTSPISYGHFCRRNGQLTELGKHLAYGDTATILVGDLNTVPWDLAFRRFCATAGLVSTTSVQQRTWPSVGPFALIPLDHLLISPGITLASLRTIHIPGSDHRGLIADLNVTNHAR